MDRVRSAFNRMVQSERYSRFTLQPAVDGERHIEVKLSEDAAEAGDSAGGSPSFRPAPRRQPRSTLCYLALGTLLIFVTGYVLGYISHREKAVEAASCAQGAEAAGHPVVTPDDYSPDDDSPEANAQMDWEDVTQLLTQKLTSQDFEKTLSDFDSPRRLAGSAEDVHLVNRVFGAFKDAGMDPWNDVHYVQLQTPDSLRPNRVVFGSDVFEPTGYLAYSATGAVQGELVYGNYGRPEDLDVLRSSGVGLSGAVLLLRAGKISFAEQVNNAAAKGAAAALIYPDSQDYDYVADTALYGHVHLGSGDPYTPGFPSFNHTQFPPANSSGLPKIPAQTITASMALALLQKIGGPESAASFKGGLVGVAYRLGGSVNVTVEVNNVLVNKELHNVFGVIKGFTDPDRYVVLGAQRDAWGKGYARATVGTAVLVQLARAVREMVNGNDETKTARIRVQTPEEPGVRQLERRRVRERRRHRVAGGRGSFMASASPLLYSLLENTMRGVKSPLGSVYDMVGTGNWDAQILKPMSSDDPAYPFLAFSGIPSVSFHFISPGTEAYSYYGTNLDSVDHLAYQTNHRTGEMAALAAQFAGQMALRLVHDHLIRLDVGRYSNVVTKAVSRAYRRVQQLTKVGPASAYETRTSGQLKGVDGNWLNRARGSFQRAARGLNTDIQNTDLTDVEAARILNDRLMTVEHSLLSPYVSPLETPFRHILLGRGAHTLASVAETDDMEQLHTQLALATWTLQGCANAMVGNIWDLDQQI
ncbi:Transferrin receptor protein 1 [Liparis tanakae]|uniref:Transferrin receptor protein 1 n=1 Tax=Liparis tanakae TaxID=230148 RepID=A0A4Z2FVM8_9TELE|nr:Transferrin receptor protein 1 [Liparis tanakae]